MAKAVIKTGGKQYLVSPGEKIRIEKLEKAVGDSAVFENGEVLLYENNGEVEIGDPSVKGVKVSAKVLSQDKEKKVVIFKFKNKTRSMVKKGHRQPYTEIEIKEISKK